MMMESWCGSPSQCQWVELQLYMVPASHCWEEQMAAAAALPQLPSPYSASIQPEPHIHVPVCPDMGSSFLLSTVNSHHGSCLNPLPALHYQSPPLVPPPPLTPSPPPPNLSLPLTPTPTAPSAAISIGISVGCSSCPAAMQRKSLGQCPLQGLRGCKASERTILRVQITLQHGEIGRQANGAVMLQDGETVSTGLICVLFNALHHFTFHRSAASLLAMVSARTQVACKQGRSLAQSQSCDVPVG